MKALFYTIILSAILVVAVIYLRSIPPRDPVTTETLETDPTISLDAESRSMAVHSQPATLSNIDPTKNGRELAQTFSAHYLRLMVRHSPVVFARQF